MAEQNKKIIKTYEQENLLMQILDKLQIPIGRTEVMIMLDEDLITKEHPFTWYAKAKAIAESIEWYSQRTDLSKKAISYYFTPEEQDTILEMINREFT